MTTKVGFSDDLGLCMLSRPGTWKRGDGTLQWLHPWHRNGLRALVRSVFLLKASDPSIPEPLSHPSASPHVQRLCVSRMSQSAGSKEEGEDQECGKGRVGRSYRKSVGEWVREKSGNNQNRQLGKGPWGSGGRGEGRLLLGLLSKRLCVRLQQTQFCWAHWNRGQAGFPRLC